MERQFVVVSGLPGSGKTTLARRLAPALNLPLIDKDDILDGQFESQGIGDAAWRRTLSRESDAVFEAAAMSSSGAILVSCWHLPGMATDSGTSTHWLSALSKVVVNVDCLCSPDVAAGRFEERTRHVGHLDTEVTAADRLASIRAQSRLGHLDIQPRIEVDTSVGVDVE